MPLLTIPEEEAAQQAANLIAQTGINALLGYAMVFFGLILLMVMVIIIGKLFTTKTAKPVAAPAPEEEAPAAPVAEGPKAPGAAGELKLNNVDPKTAAMLMAIVADKMQKPVNELRFLSIKEVQDK